MKCPDITMLDETSVKVGKNTRNQHRLYPKLDTYIRDTKREVRFFVDNTSTDLGVALRPEKLIRCKIDRRNEMGQI